METYQIIKKLLTDGGKCLLIEDGKPIGVVLTIEEYEKLQNKSETGNPKPEVVEQNPIGEAMIKEMNFPEASAELADIALTDDITLEDIGLDELPYID